MARAQTRGKSAQSKGKTSSQARKSSSAGRMAGGGSKRGRTSAQGQKSAQTRKPSQGGKSMQTRGSARKSTRARKGSTSSARKSSARSSPTVQAIDLLIEDHRMVQKMFRQGERKREDTESLQQIVQQACDALTQHADIEEQYFYPVMREEADERDLIAEAEVEHASAKQLIAELQQMKAEDERYAATFKVLGEYVNHHIDEEEKQIFPKARRAKVDLSMLQQALEQRGQEATAPASDRMEASSQGERGGSRLRARGRGGRDGSEEEGKMSSRQEAETERGDEAEQPRRTRSRGRGGSVAEEGGAGNEIDEQPRGGVEDEGGEERAGRDA
ncbi:MAG TPA: hemerythrin domain-containing protein [Casimicrobiaceae bacterium]|nr:hemerythrin domain-containing protein [Casimicrobiaceae bacterium]